MPAKQALRITVMDLQGQRLAVTERDLRRLLRQFGLEAQVICVSCGLEIARWGYSCQTPVLMVDGHAFSASQELTHEVLEEFCRRLVQWQAAHSEGEAKRP